MIYDKDDQSYKPETVKSANTEKLKVGTDYFCNSCSAGNTSSHLNCLVGD